LLLELSELQLAALTLGMVMQKRDRNDKPTGNSRRNLTQDFNDEAIRIKFIHKELQQSAGFPRRRD
jgi:hypothetical protein